MTAVFLSDGPLFVLTQERIEEIRALAMQSALGRARFCLHASAEDPVQEMIIAIVRDSHFSPHCHPRKSESLHVVSGRLGLVIFDGDGAITRRLILSAADLQAPAFYRIGPGVWHGVFALSELVVVHEVTAGPFNPDASRIAPWAPQAFDEVARYRRQAVGE